MVGNVGGGKAAVVGDGQTSLVGDIYCHKAEGSQLDNLDQYTLS